MAAGARLLLLACLIYTLGAALACLTVGKHLPNGVIVVMSFGTLTVMGLFVLLMPRVSRSAYDGFGVGLSVTAACEIAGLCSILWMAVELHFLRRRRAASRLASSEGH